MSKGRRRRLRLAAHACVVHACKHGDSELHERAWLSTAAEVGC